MAEKPYRHGEDAETVTERPDHRRIDPVTLVIGIDTLVASAYALTDGVTWLPGADLRWLLAGGAVLVGVLMLGASLKRR